MPICSLRAVSLAKAGVCFGFVCSWGCFGGSYFGGLLPLIPAHDRAPALFFVWHSDFGLRFGLREGRTQLGIYLKTSCRREPRGPQEGVRVPAGGWPANILVLGG